MQTKTCHYDQLCIGCGSSGSAGSTDWVRGWRGCGSYPDADDSAENMVHDISYNFLFDIAGVLTWAKLQLSLWNFNMLPITRAWMGDCYSAHFDVWFVRRRVFCPNTKTVITHSIMNGISPIFIVCLSDEGTQYMMRFFIWIVCTAPHPNSYFAHLWIHTHSGGIPCECARLRYI
jgi:hypothetical protein